MNLRKIIILIIVVAAVFLIVSSAMAKKPVVEQEMAIWELTKTKVVDPGHAVDMKEGTFITGYTIEAKARAKGGNVVPEGEFRLTMDAFSPFEDMDNQKAGRWYVQGNWTITKKDADPESLKVKHNPNQADGALIADLTFNPTEGQGKWTGKAVMQMGLAAGRWSRGEGTLTFGDNMEGDLFLDLDRWAEVR